MSRVRDGSFRGFWVFKFILIVVVCLLGSFSGLGVFVNICKEFFYLVYKVYYNKMVFEFIKSKYFVGKDIKIILFDLLFE